MPDIRLRNQPFDITFHPSEPILFASLLTGEVKAFRYDETDGETSATWTVRPFKRTARALSIDNGDLWMGGKGGGLFHLDAATGILKGEREAAHGCPINRVHCVNFELVASGDDDGVIKLWDPRQTGAIRAYTQHCDYISDFCYFEDKRQLVSTSGDGHLSVIDIRSSKTSPLSTSDDQEDELLSIIPIKGGTKAVVGTGLGILSVWNRKMGWGDCVDRIPGHPASVDALVALTPDLIATGSEDGMIRVMQVMPNKFFVLVGVIATHEEYPIERIKLDRTGKWLGSVSHDDCVKLTDVSDLFEDSGSEDEEMDKVDGESGLEDAENSGPDEIETGNDGAEMDVAMKDIVRATVASEDESEDEEMDTPTISKTKRGKGGLGEIGRPSKPETENFFADL